MHNNAHTGKPTNVVNSIFNDKAFHDHGNLSLGLLLDH